MRTCLRVGRNGTYENQATGTKLGFLSIGDDPSKARCSVIPRIKGDAVQAIKSSWMAEVTFECAGFLPTTLFKQIMGAGRPIKSDVWQVHEWLVDVGDINQANGSFKWWINGQLVVDKQGQKFRTTNNSVTHGVYRWRWAPTWGGIQGIRTRIDYYYMDDVYVSGYGKP